jgi:hypothetical protein
VDYYNFHYAASHTVGMSGGNTDGLREALAFTARADFASRGAGDKRFAEMDSIIGPLPSLLITAT